MNKKTLVFGLGPGRCGTATLAYLLNEQENSLVFHELFPVLPWITEDSSMVQWKWEQLHHQSHQYHVTGEVATHYLPWVPFLVNSYNSNDYLQAKFNFRFIVLKRDIEEVVESYLTKFKIQGNNPFHNHDGTKYIKNEWDNSYPKYDDLSLENAIRKYTEEYYQACENYSREWPSLFLIVNTEDLNKEGCVQDILGFVGIQESKQRIFTNIKKNSTKK